MRRVISVVGVVVLVVALAPAATATAGTLVITSDTILTEDHHGSIVIGADNITLDCGIYNAVLGPDQENGIVVDGYTGVTVQNCEVVGFDGYGIWVGSTRGTRLLNNTAGWNGLSGIDIVGSTDAVVTDNVTRQNGLGSGYSGIDIEGSSSVTVQRNVSFGNEGNGFYTFMASGIEFVDNHASGNGNGGFSLDEGTTASTFLGNWAVSNESFGFIATSSGQNRFIRNNIRGNGDVGVALHHSPQNMIRENLIEDNGVQGIRVDGSDRNQILYNDVRANGLHGVMLQNGSDYNAIRYNDVLYNGSSGIPVSEGSDRNILEGNVVSHNGDQGVHIFTAHNTVLSNRASSNGDAGFRLSGAGARGNKLARNAGCNNAAIDAVKDPDAGPGNVWLFNSFCTSEI
jgi:parallel beta-helix repeat protein